MISASSLRGKCVFKFTKTLFSSLPSLFLSFVTLTRKFRNFITYYRSMVGANFLSPDSFLLRRPQVDLSAFFISLSIVTRFPPSTFNMFTSRLVTLAFVSVFVVVNVMAIPMPHPPNVHLGVCRHHIGYLVVC